MASSLWWKWFPWRFILSRAARAQGFLDPILLLSRLRRFAQPSEVIAPTELLRGGAVLHARGLINSQAIQHNLDWVWPFWVVRQFDPRDEAFVPRAFSLTHINLTHRNWTAVGVPDAAELPIVDPRGLLTPHLDGWSLDAWLLGAAGEPLLPSKADGAAQEMLFDGRCAIQTTVQSATGRLSTVADVISTAEGPVCRWRVEAEGASGGWLVVALRPFNAEGVSFIHDIAPLEDGPGWLVNREQTVRFGAPPDRLAYATYREGDVYRRLLSDGSQSRGASCDVGLASAAALFRLDQGAANAVDVTVPLGQPSRARRASRVPASSWEDALRGAPRLSVPDPRTAFLYEAALRSLILHSPGDVYPGPYTYKRFWFRDAAFIVHALACAGLFARVERVLDRFPARQTPFGHFRSQDGEWDSNGQVLWAYQQYALLSGRPVRDAWRSSLRRGAQWIKRKRVPEQGHGLHGGLLPAGFSAEHLGPNDFYYWDDFWSVAGLHAASQLLSGEPHAEAWAREAESLMAAIERSLAGAAQRLGEIAIPASPYRRLDAGSIGSLAAGYPLALWSERDPRLLATAEHLMRTCFVGGGFFQEMSHSGINPYLTLHIAQVLLRAGDARALDLVRTVAGLASSTGQWPEAVHPRTLGGCMGDGQHVWASAEWLLIIRNSFVREEPGRLVLCSGLPLAWLTPQVPVEFGPAPTRYGPVTVRVERGAEGPRVTWQAVWRGQPPRIEIRLPGYRPEDPPVGHTSQDVKAATSGGPC